MEMEISPKKRRRKGNEARRDREDRREDSRERGESFGAGEVQKVGGGSRDSSGCGSSESSYGSDRSFQRNNNDGDTEGVDPLSFPPPRKVHSLSPHLSHLWL